LLAGVAGQRGLELEESALLERIFSVQKLGSDLTLLAGYLIGCG
jgi:hypothetical protein